MSLLHTVGSTFLCNGSWEGGFHDISRGGDAVLHTTELVSHLCAKTHRLDSVIVFSSNDWQFCFFPDPICLFAAAQLHFYSHFWLSKSIMKGFLWLLEGNS